MTATVTVTNTGKVDGKEVAVVSPLMDWRKHKARERIERFSKKIEKFWRKVKLLCFSINTNDLKYYHADMSYDWEPGEFEIMIGGDSKT